MIVRENKGFETNSMYPITDWYNEGNYVIDETTEEGKALAEKILQNYPFYDLVVENGQLIDINIYPDIEFSIDKTQITTTEVANITITNPNTVTAIIDNQEYTVSDGIIEYSNENVGTHQVVLKAEGYKDARITIEVI